MPTIIFCVRCDLSPPQCTHEQRQSRRTKYQDRTNIAPEKANNHGSSQCGNMWKCAASGAISPINASNIGNPQQKICGNIVAIIPTFTALFFIQVPFLSIDYIIFIIIRNYYFIDNIPVCAKNIIICQKEQIFLHLPTIFFRTSRLCICLQMKTYQAILMDYIWKMHVFWPYVHQATMHSKHICVAHRMLIHLI